MLVAYAVGTHFRSDWILWVEMWRGAIFDERLRPVVRASNDLWVEEIADLIREGRAATARSAGPATRRARSQPG